MKRLVNGDLEVDGKTYKYRHTSLYAGYIGRKKTLQECVADAQPYHGRYGDGYTVHTPNYNTQRYHDCSYYIASPN